MFVNVASYVIGAAVSFVVAALVLKRDKSQMDDDDDSLARATDVMRELKGTKSGKPEIKKIVFACDAGMGSSAMGASMLNSRMKKAGIHVLVENSAVNEIPEDADIVVTHKDLTERAKQCRPDAIHVAVADFLNSPEYEELINQLKSR
jgi:PTS system mannitol-specific IIC component